MEKDKKLESLHQQTEEMKEMKRRMLSQYKYLENIQGGLTFSQALEAVKKGLAICRKGWNGKGLFVTLFRDDFRTFLGIQKMLLLHYPDGMTYTWVPSISDLLAEDWEVSICD